MAKRVQISAMVEPHTMELIDQERGERSRGQYLDWLVGRRVVAGLGIVGF